MNKIKFMIPDMLSPYIDNKKEIVSEIEGEQSLIEYFQTLADQYPDLRERMFENEKQLRSYLLIFVNDENIRESEEVEALKLKNGDVIEILTALSGG